MAKDYKSKEAALIARFLATFPEELNTDRVKPGDVDSVLTAIFDQGADCGVFLDFNGGNMDSRPPFNKPIWIWETLGVFLIRYTDSSVEEKMRDIVGRLASMFDPPNHTLGGLTPLVRFTGIASADPAKINDVPFYWLTFSIEIFDQG